MEDRHGGPAFGGAMLATTTTSWIEDELQGIDLGDVRRNRRCKLLMQRLAVDPQASINAACDGPSEMVSATRFFQNEAVREEGILAPHRQATLRRMKQEPVVLVIQDTTELDFTYEKLIVLGTGPLNDENRLGLLDHVQLAVTPQRLCLGVLGGKTWARDAETFRTCKQRKYDPIETKESYRWLEGYREACRVAAEVPNAQIISVGDAENDIYECFVEAEKAQAPARAEWIMRASENRATPERDGEAGPCTYRKVRDEIGSAKVLGKLTLQLPRTPKRKARQAELSVHAKQIRLRPPYRKGEPLPEITLNVILVQERNPPPGAEPIEWLLLTSLPIRKFRQVQRAIAYYAARWPVEVFFRTLKTGCRVEHLQLHTVARLRRCLMIYKIIAWRVLYVTMLGREVPDLPCDAVFSAEEWKSAWTICAKEPPPRKAPPLKTFLPLIARLGGYKGRKGDGPPGPKTMWIAIRRITDFALAWLTFGPEQQPPALSADRRSAKQPRQPRGG
jgi:hypothetical protein